MVAPTSFFLDYGCHVRILEEARVLQRLGHQVTILTYHLGRDLPGLEIIRTRPTPWRADYEVGSSLHKLAFDLFLGWRMLGVILRRRFDLIHAHLYDGALIGAVVGWLRRLPLLFDRQGSLTGEMVDHGFLRPDGPWYRWVHLLEERINHMAEVIVTSTQLGAVQLERYFGCDSAHVRPLPDCVNLEFFQPGALPPEEVTARRVALGLPADGPVVVYVGLLADYQGVPHMLRAARILKERGVRGSFLIGGFPKVEHYRRMAADLGVSDRVVFTGKVPYQETPAYLALGDIAVAPKLSATEGSGKILNYMAMELPTVAFDTPVSREYLGSLGVYAKPAGDPAALADGIQALVEQPDLRLALGKGLRRRAARHFSWDRAGRQLVNIYRELVGSQPET
ncbi:MAG TPA: glycosyltransferase family 1 protein [Anaerolineales bacterium]|nr:glycosyltransferase family 1 protein [Anaerolineae bacterium]HIQ01142.1 glycosyltransferase family 1 protein [Anaerolineales bacterium]